jgi:hypothetical protein
MSIDSEARGISQRHKPWVGPDSRWHCECCHCLWNEHGCPDRLAADAITQAADEAVEKLRAIIDLWSDDVSHLMALRLTQTHAVAALASLTGQDAEE